MSSDSMEKATIVEKIDIYDDMEEEEEEKFAYGSQSFNKDF